LNWFNFSELLAWLWVAVRMVSTDFKLTITIIGDMKSSSQVFEAEIQSRQCHGQADHVEN
jgi:hypothetical protein